MRYVDSAALDRYRQNPATAAQGDLVICLECGLMVRRLTRSPNCHARRVHKLDAAAYLAKWPGAPLLSIEAKQEEHDAHELYKETHVDKLKAYKREYIQRPEVKVREAKKRRERWPKWYADHRDAELQRSRDKHQRFRDRDNERQRQRYQENLEAEQAKNREKQRKMRARAWRPPDWNDKPIEWRIIGTELLSQQEYMSNRELAGRLDGSRILTCPYGENWIESVSEKAFVKLITQIRAWVKRPGKVR